MYMCVIAPSMGLNEKRPKSGKRSSEKQESCCASRRTRMGQLDIKNEEQKTGLAFTKPENRGSIQPFDTI